MSNNYENDKIISDHEILKLEEKFKKQLPQFERMPTEERIAILKSRVESNPNMSIVPNDSYERVVIKKKTWLPVAFVALSLILVLSIWLPIHFSQDRIIHGDPDERPITREDVVFMDMSLNILREADLFLPNLEMLNGLNIELGEHRVNSEMILFFIEGRYGECAVTLKIILHEDYEAQNEQLFRGDNIVNINGREMSVFEQRVENEYVYWIGFEKNEIRYFTILTTAQRGSYVDFLNAFFPA